MVALGYWAELLSWTQSCRAAPRLSSSFFDPATHTRPLPTSSNDSLLPSVRVKGTWLTLKRCSGSQQRHLGITAHCVSRGSEGGHATSGYSASSFRQTDSPGSIQFTESDPVPLDERMKPSSRRLEGIGKKISINYLHLFLIWALSHRPDTQRPWARCCLYKRCVSCSAMWNFALPDHGAGESSSWLSVEYHTCHYAVLLPSLLCSWVLPISPSCSEVEELRSGGCRMLMPLSSELIHMVKTVLPKWQCISMVFGLSAMATWLSGVISTLQSTLNFHNVWFNLGVVDNMDDRIRCNTSAARTARKVAKDRYFNRHLLDKSPTAPGFKGALVTSTGTGWSVC